MFQENHVSGKHISFQAGTKWSFCLCRAKAMFQENNVSGKHVSFQASTKGSLCLSRARTMFQENNVSGKHVDVSGKYEMNSHPLTLSHYHPVNPAMPIRVGQVIQSRNRLGNN